ncbi:Zn-dependent oxidoreductase, NADPH:quinone reductase [Frankia canadensis]|uniref:Zn-dependent oxidoreductase, NADPH:quinone reductase n=1 Tax=Frankia canadensis TaxID=1836972 RepID=A0A2I2KHW7_9ACTN|nr:NADP-dependent oxidoreductase [Frankia canadensis]SNQ45252.1 Zn-dependent oxidoreductase, NADPH:quinone reductase [Frankia canadensis]SOU52542.1 Zn-dependent oxidoreductase, NADPH:quinone reductase [Frankia canadensis]
MRAVGVNTWGGPEVLEIVELPEPHAGPGQIRLRVHAATVNPADTLIRSGARADRIGSIPPPYVPGMEVAGIVDEIGDRTDELLTLGSPAMAIVLPLGSYGAYSEYVVVPKGSVAPAPAGTDLVHAATLPMNGLTARRALDLLDPPPGATVAVTGAAGAFGGYFIQLAVNAGHQVVADASETDRQLVADLGAHMVVSRGAKVAEHIRQVAPDGVAALADGSVQKEAVLAAVADGGAIASVRGPAGVTERGIRWTPVSVYDVAEDRARLDGLRVLVESGAITLRVAASCPAEKASEVHERLQQGGTRGRFVLTF